MCYTRIDVIICSSAVLSYIASQISALTTTLICGDAFTIIVTIRTTAISAVVLFLRVYVISGLTVVPKTSFRPTIISPTVSNVVEQLIKACFSQH